MTSIWSMPLESWTRTVRGTWIRKSFTSLFADWIYLQHRRTATCSSIGSIVIWMVCSSTASSPVRSCLSTSTTPGNLEANAYNIAINRQTVEPPLPSATRRWRATKQSGFRSWKLSNRLRRLKAGWSLARSSTSTRPSGRVIRALMEQSQHQM